MCLYDVWDPIMKPSHLKTHLPLVWLVIEIVCVKVTLYKNTAMLELVGIYAFLATTTCASKRGPCRLPAEKKWNLATTITCK